MKLKNCLKFVLIIILFFVNAGFCNEPQQIIGIYDSRAIAIANFETDEFQMHLKEIKKKYNLAKEKKEKKMMKFYEKQGKTLQKELHKQVFSTYPVDEILLKYTKEIENLKNKKKVNLLISKWNKKELKKYKNNKQIDATKDLVELIIKDEKKRKHALEIVDKKPVSKFVLFFALLFH